MNAHSGVGTMDDANLGGYGTVVCTFCIGSPRFLDQDLAAIATTQGTAAAWSSAFDRFATAAPTHVTGDFAVAARESAGRTFLAVDRFAIKSLCYRREGDGLRFAERADQLAGRVPELDPQSLFDYLYFHYIPAPRTVFKDVYRLQAGHCAVFEDGKLTVTPWWMPIFEENSVASFALLREEFRALLRDAVASLLHGRRTGAFLSGGTDSSTVVGMLRTVTGAPPETFSIGFDAEGYDEMAYARLTARHFGANHHEYYVTPDDLVRSIPAIAAEYDQPFGNSSVAPAYYCAKLAKESGVDHLLAGDGGDELFGGNTRYAKQRVFAAYDKLPAFIRNALLEPALLGWPLPAKVPGLRKAVSYVEQARVPMPDRLQMYNVLVRLGLGNILTTHFLARIDADEPMRQQRETYAACDAQSLVNKMLAYDWKYTLADNDIPKVVGATSLAGVAVGFPMLDNRVVDFSLRLQPAYKLKRLGLRWFFKESLRGFLPDATLVKKKHGFGLPFGVWLTRHAGLQALALESLDLLRGRGIIRADFLDRLLKDYLPQHPGYYGEMVWILVMLAQWGLASNHHELH